MPKPPRPSALEVLRHNLLILVGLPSLILQCLRLNMDQVVSPCVPTFEPLQIIHQGGKLVA